ncbi:MAG TPA: hypothetical protein VFB50_12175, partial [Chloroflexota bacterium]|nr:hypothetical protein [Chloroflexota bacterium]
MIEHRYDAILLGVTLAIGLGLIARAYSVRVSRDTVNPYRMEVTRPLGSGPRQQVRANWTTARQTTLLAWLATVTVSLLLAGCAHDLVAWLLADIRAHGLGTVKQAIAAAVAGATAFGSIFTAIKASPTGGHDARDVGQPGAASQLVFALTPPLVVVVVGVLASWASLECLRWVLADFEHRVGPLTIAALAGISLCVVFAAYEFHDDLPADGGEQAPRWLAVGLLAVVAYVVVCFLPLELAWVVGHAGSAWAEIWVRALLAATLALLFIATTLHRTRWRVVSLAGFALGVLCSLYVIGRGWPDALIALSPAGLRSDPLYAGWCLFATLGALVVTLGWMADPNALSMHTFYKTRLVRGYLGASNSQRRRELRDITETATGDDIHLQDLATSRAGGPYHLINTTLNLVGGRDLTTAQRSAVNFVLTRRFCGSVRTGYRDTRWYMGGELTLGAAIAASGAAVSPAMGSRTPTAALTMLLAFLNVRLGLWVPAPHKAYWRTPQTRLWPFYLLRESLSQANDVIAYCYLTDGGHFDNTGLHALVERACRFIVVVDNGADPEPC